MGSGVRVVDRSLYLPTRDTQRIFKLTNARAQGPSATHEQRQELAHAVQVVEDLVILATVFMKTESGFVEGVSRAFLRTDDSLEVSNTWQRHLAESC